MKVVEEENQNQESPSFQMKNEEDSQKRPTLLFTKEQIEKSLQGRQIEWSRVVYQSYFFSVGIILMILTSFSQTDYTNYIIEYKYLTDNWRHDYYIDIQLGFSNMLCSQEFDESVYIYKQKKYIEMNQYHWPGSVNGCDCTYQKPNQIKEIKLIIDKSYEDEIDEATPINIKGTLLKRVFAGVTCSTQQLKQRCITVNEQIPKPLRLWSEGTSGEPIRLCGKTQQNVNFANSAPKNYTCDPSQIQCGSGDQLFCVGQNMSCPVNYVGFKTEMEQGNGVWVDDLEKSELDQYNLLKNLTDSGKKKQAKNIGGIITVHDDFHFFYFKNWTGYAPLSELKVSQVFDQSGVCFSSNLSNIETNNSDYPLLKIQRKNCPTDPRYKIFHKINEYQYYLSNNFLFIANDLPKYPINSNKNWGINLQSLQGIHFRGYIEWKTECRGQLFEQAIQVGDTLPNMQIAQYALFVTTIVYFVVVSLVLSLASCCSTFGVEMPCQEHHFENQSNIIFFFQAVFKISLQLLQIAIVVWAYVTSNNTRNYLKVAIDKQCSDIYTMQLFKNLYDFIMINFWQYNLAFMSLFLGTFLVDISMYIRYHRTNKLKQRLLSNTNSVKDSLFQSDSQNPSHRNFEILNSAKTSPQKFMSVDSFRDNLIYPDQNHGVCNLKKIQSDQFAAPNIDNQPKNYKSAQHNRMASDTPLKISSYSPEKSAYDYDSPLKEYNESPKKLISVKQSNDSRPGFNNDFSLVRHSNELTRVQLIDSPSKKKKFIPRGLFDLENQDQQQQNISQTINNIPEDRDEKQSKARTDRGSLR